MNILLVEDDRKLSRALSTMLEEDGHVVEAAYDGRRGLELGLENPYDVIILDVMLPQLDGISVCRTLRGKHIDIPVLMLTARTTVGDRVAVYVTYLRRKFKQLKVPVEIKSIRGVGYLLGE